MRKNHTETPHMQGQQTKSSQPQSYPKTMTAVTVALTLGLTACASLLPHGSSVTPSSFKNYEDAQQALEKVVPYQTTVQELKALGFDPKSNANVTIIPYPEVITRLAPHPGVPLEALDLGVRDCILAQTRCQAYVFRFAEETRQREGGFWLDFFNMQRTINKRGWRFEGLVVVRNEVVLFRSIGGEPHTDSVEQQINPLGPLQSGGEGAAQLLLR